MTIIVATQDYKHKNKEYKTGKVYEVSDSIATKLVENKKAKKVSGGDIQPEKVVIRTRIPKIQNRDPVSDV